MRGSYHIHTSVYDDMCRRTGSLMPYALKLRHWCRSVAVEKSMIGGVSHCRRSSESPLVNTNTPKTRTLRPSGTSVKDLAVSMKDR